MNIRTYIAAAVFFLNGSIDNYYLKNEQDLQKEWMSAVYWTILRYRENKKNCQGEDNTVQSSLNLNLETNAFTSLWTQSKEDISSLLCAKENGSGQRESVKFWLWTRHSNLVRLINTWYLLYA